MKPGDRFYHPGSWNTDAGWFEVLKPDAGCGMAVCRQVSSDLSRLVDSTPSEWFADYVAKAVERATVRELADSGVAVQRGKK